MKNLLLIALLAGLVVLPACNSDSDAPAPPPASDDDSSTDASGSDTHSQVDASADAGVAHANGSTASAATDGDADAALPALPNLADDPSDEADDDVVTLEDLNQQFANAMRSGDYPQALQAISAARDAHPDDLMVQLRWVALRVGFGDESEDDKAAAATNFIETAAVARQLLSSGEQLPSGVEQLFAEAFVNEARGYAYNRQVPETVAALNAAMEHGLTSLDSVEGDPFFANVIGDAAFTDALAAAEESIRQRRMETARRELAENEAFAFDFELPDLDQNAVKLADFEGKIVIVDFWGTWCPPCRQEIPHFVKLQETYADNLAVVGICYENGDAEQAVQNVREFADEYGINYPCLIGDEETSDRVPDLRGFPTTLFLDRSGKVRLKIVGYHAYEKLESYLLALLDEEPVEGEPAS